MPPPPSPRMQKLNATISYFIFIKKTRSRAVQTNDSPLIACINPTQLLFLKIVVNSKNDSEIWEKLSISL